MSLDTERGRDSLQLMAEEVRSLSIMALKAGKSGETGTENGFGQINADMNRLSRLDRGKNGGKSFDLRNFSESLMLLAGIMTTTDVDTTDHEIVEKSREVFNLACDKLFEGENTITIGSSFYSETGNLANELGDVFPKVTDVLERYSSKETWDKIKAKDGKFLPKMQKEITEALFEDVPPSDFKDDGFILSAQSQIDNLPKVMRLLFQAELLSKNFERIRKDRESDVAAEKIRPSEQTKVAAAEDREKSAESAAEIKDNLLLQTALESGGAGVHMSFRKDSLEAQKTGRGNAGFQSVGDSRTSQDFWDGRFSTNKGVRESGALNGLTRETAPQLYKNGSQYQDVDHGRPDNKLDKLGVNEVVTISPVQETVYREVEERFKSAGIRGVLGGVDTRVVQKEDGVRSVSHKDVVRGGNEEPAFEFYYRAYGTGTDRDNKVRWNAEGETRDGQMLILRVMFPESVAKQIAKRISGNPGFARKLVEGFLVKGFGVSEKQWNNNTDGSDRGSLRPPYEGWAKKHSDGHCRMLISTSEKIGEPLNSKIVIV